MTPAPDHEDLRHLLHREIRDLRSHLLVARIDLYPDAGILQRCLYPLRVSQMALADGYSPHLHRRWSEREGDRVVPDQHSKKRSPDPYSARWTVSGLATLKDDKGKVVVER